MTKPKPVRYPVLFRVGDLVEVRASTPAIRATVTAVKGERVRIAYSDGDGQTVRRWMEPIELRLMPMLATLDETDA